ncbi:hypothetical protein SANBI_002736 [Sanguibacter sp. 4.1]|uniref:Tox-REase-9 domain-containing protein n=1 Tax=Sanguibacter biliveldensis TaxID=3030830 RepID=A0AAF1C1U4_9MICO|nr:RHS repeat-associated core domain-containing protein [Sanguibacter sp. 4.1]WPF81440.1 hypothetical protein SANBI_002736 [Sanguibacter sp. 4.1]
MPQPLSGSGATTGPPARYGWLGAAQRSAEALNGVILMGVRLYSPEIGRFLSVDSVAGGSSSAYDYCNADPVNCTDLAGTWSWRGIVKKVAAVGEVASMIPGPIGVAAAGVSAVAYASTGNTKKALMMAGTVVAAAVGGSAIVGAAKFIRKAGSASKEFKSSLALGAKAHKKFDSYVVKKLNGKRADGYIKCGGRRCKPDGYTSKGFPIELKPHNARSIALGRRQLARYEIATSSVGKGQLWTYRQSRITKRFIFKRQY